MMQWACQNDFMAGNQRETGDCRRPDFRLTYGGQKSDGPLSEVVKGRGKARLARILQSCERPFWTEGDGS
jgi:hypothetical protein